MTLSPNGGDGVNKDRMGVASVSLNKVAWARGPDRKKRNILRNGMGNQTLVFGEKKQW